MSPLSTSVAAGGRVTLFSPGLVSFRVRETPPPYPSRPRLLDRVHAAIRARHFSRRTESDHRPPGNGQAGTRAAPGARARPAPGGPRPGRRLGRDAGRPGAQVSERGEGVGMAMGFPGHALVRRSRHGPEATSSSPRVGHPAGREASHQAGRDCQARELPYVPALLRHASPGGRARHPHRAGAARPSGRAHDDDLYPRPQPRLGWGKKPGGPSFEALTGAREEALSGLSPRVIDRTVYPGALRPVQHAMVRIFGELRAIWSRPPCVID
jgi:hypothetical protein